MSLIFKETFIFTGVYGFVDFGQRPWWYRGHFCKNAGKKDYSKRNNFKKKGKNLVVCQKYEINYAQKIRFFMFMH